MYVNGISSNGNQINRSSQSANSSNVDFASVLNASNNSSKTNLNSIFEAASEKYGVPVSLLKAIAKAESNFNSDATSCCGAMGIMQLMPGTAKSLGVNNAYDPQQNIMGGAKYLSQLLDEFGGNMKFAVAAYNAGPGNVMKYDGIPPFHETQNYVEKVMGYYKDFSGSNADSNILSKDVKILPRVSELSQYAVSGTANGKSAEFLSLLMLLNMQTQLFKEIGDNKNGQDKFSALDGLSLL